MAKKKNGRWWLFAGYTYYPAGGMSDFEGAFETIEEAKSFLQRAVGHDWFEIVDSLADEDGLRNSIQELKN